MSEASQTEFWTITDEVDKEVRMDWEGMTVGEDHNRMVALINQVEGRSSNPAVLDLTLHFVHTSVNEAGWWPEPIEVATAMAAFEMIVDCNKFMKSGIDWS